MSDKKSFMTSLLLMSGIMLLAGVVSFLSVRPPASPESISSPTSPQTPGCCPTQAERNTTPLPTSIPSPTLPPVTRAVVQSSPIPPPATKTPYPASSPPPPSYPVPSIAAAQPTPAACQANPLPAQAALLPEVAETITATVVMLPHPIQSATQAMAFSDRQHGWVANGRSIFATQNGGASWAWLADLDRPAQTLDFPSQANGWAVTESGLWSTQDGGKSWNAVSLPGQEISGTLAVRTVDFASEQRGWVGLPQVALRTADGGKTWEQVALPCQEIFEPYRHGWEYYDFSLAGEQDAWLVCGGEPAGAGSLAFKWVFKSQDDGRSWQKVAEAFSEITLTPQPGRASDLNRGFWPEVFFLDEQHGWMGTVSSGLLASQDGGATWQSVRMPIVQQGAASPIFFSPDEGIALSTAGFSLAWKTINGGQSWAPIFPPPSPYRMQFQDAVSGYGIGGWASASDVMHTQDGGSTWERLASPGEPLETMRSFQEASADCIRSVSAVHFPDDQDGWALARACTDLAIHLYRTHDGGQSWQRLPATLGPAEDYPWLSFVDEQTGYIGNTLGQLYVTHDGGDSVTLQEATVDYDVHFRFISPSEGGKIANGQLLLTIDGGCSWERVLGGYDVLAFDLLPGGKIWAKARECWGRSDTSQPCKTLLLSSADRGQHWILFHIDLEKPLEGDLFSLAAFDFSDPEHGWLRQGEHLYRTSDGGYTWEQVR